MNDSLLPADIYIVINKSIITDQDKSIINKLYLPIIGPMPVILYNTLLNDLDKKELISDTFNHAHLLRTLHITGEELAHARNSLEAIGLLKTYQKKDNVNNYIYELYSPVSSHEFFSHPIFNIVLYNNVGKNEYEKLINYFKMPKINKEGYTEITHSFSSVFDTVPYTSFDMYKDNIRKYNKLKLNIDSNFDMNFLIETMPNQIDKKIFTKDLQELIISLAYLYDIDAPKMQNILKSCLNEKGTINREELRKVSRNHYQFDHSGLLPTVIEHSQPEYLRKPVGENTKIAKMIYTFETTNPSDFLKSKHPNGEPVKRDVKLLEDLIVDYGLKPGVVIAGQWQRKNIETVEDAMNIAKKNHKSIEKQKTIKKVTKDNPLPVWFNKEIKEESATDEERQAIEDLLKEYR